MNALPDIGRLEWIGIRPLRRAAVLVVSEAVVSPVTGLVGDHYCQKRGNSREVTLIQHEHLAEIAQRMGVESVAPDLLRRNLVVSGLPLSSLNGKRFRIGDVVLSGTGPCSPCARMDEALGRGGLRAMSRRGGITATVIQGGTIRIGDLAVIISETT